MSKIIVAGAGVITPRYLRPRQAAAYASVSVRAIARAIAAGLVISHLVPGRGTRSRVRLIDREDLERFIEGRPRADAPTSQPANNRKGAESERSATRPRPPATASTLTASSEGCASRKGRRAVAAVYDRRTGSSSGQQKKEAGQ